jgi:hypothetical protein
LIYYLEPRFGTIAIPRAAIGWRLTDKILSQPEQSIASARTSPPFGPTATIGSKVTRLSKSSRWGHFPVVVAVTLESTTKPETSRHSHTSHHLSFHGAKVQCRGLEKVGLTRTRPRSTAWRPRNINNYQRAAKRCYFCIALVAATSAAAQLCASWHFCRALSSACRDALAAASREG